MKFDVNFMKLTIWTYEAPLGVTLRDKVFGFDKPYPLIH